MLQFPASLYSPRDSRRVRHLGQKERPTLSQCPHCKQEGFNAQLNTCLNCGYPTDVSESNKFFRGRIGCDLFLRRAFWLAASAIPVTCLEFHILSRLSTADSESPLARVLSIAFMLLVFTYVAAFVWLALSTAVQRCHDLNRSGWILLSAVTIIAVPVLSIYLASAQGESGPNLHGGAPLRTGRASEASLCSLKGRIGRASYWIRTLVPVAVLLLPLVSLSMLLYLVPGDNLDSRLVPGQFISFTLLFVSLPALCSSLIMLALLACICIAAGVKRCHDLGRSGWAALLCLIPYLGLIMVILLGCIRGKEGPNQYGVDPFGREPAVEHP